MTLFKILFGLVGLSIVVVIHEAGHFVAARLTGIKVEAFSIGWGRVLYRRMVKETEFRISLFPLGGYCKMKGEQAMSRAWENKARTIDAEQGDFYRASWLSRIAVSLSGPGMNLLFAGMIFFFVSLIGYQIHYYPPRIVLASQYNERQDYPADAAGLKSADLITAVNGKGIQRFDQLQHAIALHPQENLDFTVDRQGCLIEIQVRPEINKDSGAGYLGVYPWIEALVREVADNDRVPVQKGDLLLRANGKEIRHALDYSRILETETLKDITILRNGSTRKIELSEQQEPPIVSFQYLSMRTDSGKILPSLAEGAKQCWNTLTGSLKGLGLLFKGLNLQSAVSGPLRITYMTGDLAVSGFKSSPGAGFLSFFRFLALINVALFIMNLLPIPVLDGGQILLFLWEGISHKKPNPVVLYRYQMVGTFIVFGIIILATMNDILFFTGNH